MNTKQVSQLDYAGYFIGTAVADESPLEAGVFLLPAGSIDVPAPDIPEGKIAKWEGAWVFEDIPQPQPSPEPAPVDPKEVRIAELKQFLKESDYKVLPDYDKPSEEIKVQRQAWREEIRALEAVTE